MSSPGLDDAIDGYELNVFVNCPFDDRYLSLLRPLLENRLDKICELIRHSQLSIHDLSRLKAVRAREFYRLNMPFELGIDYGSRQHGPAFMRGKKCLILERSPHDFRIALSDLSGVDIKSHGNQPDEIVRAVRDWFYETVGHRDTPYPKVIWFRFKDFTTSLFESRLAEGIPEDDVRDDLAKMPIPEFLDCVADWVETQKGASEPN